MNFLNILGLFAATLTTIAFLPQMLKIWRSQSANDVSFTMLITFITGLVLWLIYGMVLGALPIIIANSVTLCFNLIILWLKIKYR
ncbi:MAG TPA: SemiSWEET transporter [Nostocaceae cyanobacterium]|nr:SemiSWEET transporter [Nostocaceae cyanobacterium]